MIPPVSVHELTSTKQRFVMDIVSLMNKGDVTEFERRNHIISVLSAVRNVLTQ